jgi:hypothetical protein
MLREQERRAGAQSAPAVSSAEARRAIEAGYVEWAKARLAMDKNTIERMLAPDLYVFIRPKSRPKTYTAGVYRCNLLQPVYLNAI